MGSRPLGSGDGIADEGRCRDKKVYLATLDVDSKLFTLACLNWPWRNRYQDPDPMQQPRCRAPAVNTSLPCQWT